MDLAAIQAELRQRACAAWLFFDHHRRDAMAYRILGLSQHLCTRRWYYLIPAQGTPRKVVHRIESGVLDAIPGDTRLYARWDELDQNLRWLLDGLGPRPAVAMQYSPNCTLPALSLVDAGTVEQVRALGCTVVSSADLISRFDATWSDAMLESHRAAGAIVDETIGAAFAEIRLALDTDRPLNEVALQNWIVDRLRTGGCVVDDLPIVAVNAHAGDPHYEPSADHALAIDAGDLVLLDVWARLDQPGSAFYDVTWVGYCLRPGEKDIPPRFAHVFDIVRQARDAGVTLVSEAVAARRPVRGCDVDRAVRTIIEDAGYGPAFVHRTGHSLGLEVHASGANLDDYETRDERLILPHTAFTIEPGIYRPGGEPFGIRSEVNVYVGTRAVEVTSPRQHQIVRI